MAMPAARCSLRHGRHAIFRFHSLSRTGRNARRVLRSIVRARGLVRDAPAFDARDAQCDRRDDAEGRCAHAHEQERRAPDGGNAFIDDSVRWIGRAAGRSAIRDTRYAICAGAGEWPIERHARVAKQTRFCEGWCRKMNRRMRVHGLAPACSVAAIELCDLLRIAGGASRTRGVRAHAVEGM